MIRFCTHFAPLSYQYLYDPLIDIAISERLPIDIDIDIFQNCLNQVPNLPESNFVEIGRALFNPGKLWVVSVAVGAAGRRVGGSGYGSHQRESPAHPQYSFLSSPR